MKGCIVFAGIEDALQGWPDNRSLALQNLAGSCVLGHVLGQLRHVRFEGLTILVDKDEEAIKSWVEGHVEDSQIQVLANSDWANPLQALQDCKELFGNSPLLLLQGSDITEANFGNLDQGTADVIVFERNPESEPLQSPTNRESVADSPWAGAIYFRQSHSLMTVVELALAKGYENLGSLHGQVPGDRLTVHVEQAAMCLDTRSVTGLILANARLLSLGYGSENAIERSYVEDFTVIPPVFLHETAEIVNSVVGPFANIEAGARIVSSVIRSSLIGKEAVIENEVLEGSLIGERAHVNADSRALLVNSEQRVGPGGLVH